MFIECFNNIMENFNIEVCLEDDGGNLCILFKTDKYENEFYAHILEEEIIAAISNLQNFIDGKTTSFIWNIYDCDTETFQNNTDYLNNAKIELESIKIQDKVFIKIKLDFIWYDWMYKQYLSSNYGLKVSEIDNSALPQERSFKYITVLSEVQKFIDLLETYHLYLKLK